MLSVWGSETGSKRLLALAEPLAFVPAEPPVVVLEVVLELVLELVPVFEFASVAEVLSGSDGGVVQPHSRAVSKLI